MINKFLSLILTLCVADAIAQNTTLDAQLVQMGNKDQQVRLELNDAVKSGNIEQIQQYAEQMTLIDKTNQQTLSAILTKWGSIPHDLSAEAYTAIFHIIDHADLKYQKQNLRYLVDAQRNGLIKSSQVAVLRDRMLMSEGKRQIYGTQTIAKPIIITADGEAPEMVNYVWAVRNPKHLDKRRADVGLGTIESQQESHAALGYNLIFDPSLSKREIKRLTTKKKK